MNLSCFAMSVEGSQGIFCELFKRTGKNPVEAGLVKVIPSDEVCNNVGNIILENWKQHWFSFHPNPFVVFDFSPQKVVISSYFLKTYSGGPNCGHLKSWILEGSNDGSDFAEIAVVNDCHKLNSSAAEATFSIDKEVPAYQQIRLRMVGLNHAGSDFMVIRRIEFFGDIIE